MLNNQQVVRKLQWFYALELTQVDSYQAQSQAVQDPYIRRALRRIATIEQQHVDNIAAAIRERGGVPAPPLEALAPFAGRLLGSTTGLLSVTHILRVNVAIEAKAMRDYKAFLRQLGPLGSPDLRRLLWSNLIDEDLHTAWLRSTARQLEGTLPRKP